MVTFFHRCKVTKIIEKKYILSFSFCPPMSVRIPHRLRSLPCRMLLPSPAGRKNIFNSYKTIIVISFIINIILLVFAFYTISNNKLYAFSGKDDYIEVKDGIIALNNDINFCILFINSHLFFS